jgi:hypothetical protein
VVRKATNAEKADLKLRPTTSQLMKRMTRLADEGYMQVTHKFRFTAEHRALGPVAGGGDDHHADDERVSPLKNGTMSSGCGKLATPVLAERLSQVGQPERG